ncbi:hypothetical protein [Glycomyces sp. MUSA5-2]|uniref:hypothetical protein n=1 Tax=Glycomyces sp. MUSA5-2 TaxID=2053002 RepID=UPI0030094443
MELVWSVLSGTMLTSFRDIEPHRIGTVVFGGRSEPSFVAQPGHLDWLAYENRAARILEAAVQLFEEQPGS